MGWGIMGGLGQALTTIGGQWDEKSKTLLRDKLDQEREKREQSKYDPTQDRYELTNTDGGELWYKVRRNKNGDVIDRELAPKNVIEELTSAREDRALSSRLKKTQVDSAEYTFGRAKTTDERSDKIYNAIGQDDHVKAARIGMQLDPSANAKLQADTSLQGAVLRGSGKNSDSEEGIDFIGTAKDFAAQEPDAFRQIADMFGTSDSGTYSRLAGVLQFLLKEMPDRKPSASDVIAAAQALKAKYKIKDSNSAPTGAPVKRPSITG